MTKVISKTTRYVDEHLRGHKQKHDFNISVRPECTLGGDSCAFTKDFGASGPEAKRPL